MSLKPYFSPGFLPISKSHMCSWLLDISMWMPTLLKLFVLFIPHTTFLPLFPIFIQFRESNHTGSKPLPLFFLPCFSGSLSLITYVFHNLLPPFHFSRVIFIILCLCGHNNLKTCLSATSFTPSNLFCT